MSKIACKCMRPDVFSVWNWLQKIFQPSLKSMQLLKLVFFSMGLVTCDKRNEPKVWVQILFYISFILSTLTSTRRQSSWWGKGLSDFFFRGYLTDYIREMVTWMSCQFQVNALIRGLAELPVAKEITSTSSNWEPDVFLFCFVNAFIWWGIL